MHVDQVLPSKSNPTKSARVTLFLPSCYLTLQDQGQRRREEALGPGPVCAFIYYTVMAAMPDTVIQIKLMEWRTHLLPPALAYSMNRSCKGAVSPSESPHHYHDSKGSTANESFVGGLTLYGGHKATFPFGSSPHSLYTVPRRRCMDSKYVS